MKISSDQAGTPVRFFKESERDSIRELARFILLVLLMEVSPLFEEENVIKHNGVDFPPNS